MQSMLKMLFVLFLSVAFAHPMAMSDRLAQLSAVATDLIQATEVSGRRPSQERWGEATPFAAKDLSDAATSVQFRTCRRDCYKKADKWWWAKETKACKKVEADLEADLEADESPEAKKALKIFETVGGCDKKGLYMKGMFKERTHKAQRDNWATYCVSTECQKYN